MADVLVETQLNTKGNRADRFKEPSRCRFTKPTFSSLKTNIKSFLQRKFDEYNQMYNEYINAIVSAEVTAAENEVRASITQTVDKDEEKRLTLVKEDEEVAGMTRVNTVKQRMQKVLIDIFKLGGRFGTLGENFGSNVKPKFLPKALSVPRIKSKVYRGISRNVSLYKYADKLDSIDPSLVAGPQNGETPSNVPRYKQIFEKIVTKQPTNVTVAMNSQPTRESEEKVEVIPEQSGVSSADFSHRNILAQINDELEEVRRLLESPNGFASPFSSGLQEREESLKSMLQSITGCESGKVVKKPVLERSNTAFQDLIDGIVGYSEPLSEAEKKEKEREMNEYYSDPFVSHMVDELRNKDTLYIMNDPEAYNKVMAAERKDNNRSVEEATALEVIGDYGDEKEEIEDTVRSLGAISQAQELKATIDENNMLMAGSVETAQNIIDSEERQKAVVGAKEQAQIFADQDERNMIIEGSLEEAKRQLEQFIKAKEKQETQMIIDGSKEQAENIIAGEERQKVVAGAKEQAQNIIAEEERQIAVNGSLETAQNIIAQEKSSLELSREGNGNDIIDINAEDNTMSMEEIVSQMAHHSTSSEDVLAGAKEQAQMFVDQDERNRVIAGSRTQAQIFADQDETNRALFGGKEQAENIIVGEERQRAVIGAKEQASNIVSMEERRRTVKGAKEQAENIVAAEERQRVINGAPETASNIISLHERQIAVNGGVEQAKALFDNYMKNANKGVASNPALLALSYEQVDSDDRFCSFASPSRPIKLRGQQFEVLSSNAVSNSRSNEENETESFEAKKQFLNTVKDSINSADFDFLRYDDSIVKHEKAA